jgi:micrococcal nuclease
VIWTVPATVERVVDGDTVEVTLDLGWKIYKRDHVRIAHVDAPELNTVAGKAARTWLNALLPVGTSVTVKSTGLDKYGRALAELKTAEGSDVGFMLLNAGHAVPYEGGPR